MHPVGFEPTHLAIAVLETAPLDHSGTNASLYIFFSLHAVLLSCYFFFFFIKMHPVGFEPTHLSIAELKSAPLDHSGTNASYYMLSLFYPKLLLPHTIINLLYLKFIFLHYY